EHGYCQAAYLLGYYNVHYRGVQQRNRERESALKQLDHRLRRAPFTYTISEIHSFTDQRGIPLTKKYSLDDVNRYISERITSPDGESLPEMIRVRCHDGQEHYLFRDFVPHVTVEHVFTARKSLRDYFIETWKEYLQRNRRPPEMTEDAAFAERVEERLREDDPLLHTLLNYNLLYLSRHEVNVPSDLAAELDEVFHPTEPRLRPLPEILNLDRKRLLTDARLLLPFWQAMPVLSSIVAFLKRVFVGRPEEERASSRERRSRRRRAPTAEPVAAGESTTVRYGPSVAASPPGEIRNLPRDLPSGGAQGGASRRAQVARFKDSVRQLQRNYVRPGSTAEQTLDELVERWNPLLDPIAKTNLVEDVNSLARDFLRRMKVSFRLIPPTTARVNEWADRLSQNEAFHQIRRRDDLKEYLKLYMLTVLAK
ncbi:MAG: hypothetical protein ACOC1U_05030, partial [Spirochaetota bacterium]